MKLINRGECRADALDDSFEGLRAGYIERLKGDRQHLLILSTALARGDAGRLRVLDELRGRAHRLSGTAAIFELKEVAALARAMELAADEAVAADGAREAVRGTAGDAAGTLRTETSDTVMCAALHALIWAIGRLGKRSRAPRTQAIGTDQRRPRVPLAG